MNPLKQKVVILVDGFSTAKYLAPLLKKRGYAVVHVQSSANIPEFFLQAFQRSHYLDHLIYENNLTRLLKNLQKYEVLAVIPGTETSIYLADLLAEALNVIGNSTKTSHCRRDKFSMINAVQRGGLETAKQFKSNNFNEVLQWHQYEMNEVWPLVVKPVNSAGTDSVRFCNNQQELKNAVENILGKKNRLGIRNEEVLVQSFLEGIEYVVNTVSLNSKHHLTDIRRCHKKRVLGAGFISGVEELIMSNEPIAETLKQYAFKALDFLGIQHGPGHFEIMVTPRGPAIIEMGARIQGGINPEANALCIGEQQLDKTIDVYLEPEKFLKYYQQDYNLKRWGVWVFLISEITGEIQSIPLIEKIKTLESFFSLQMNIMPGDKIVPTVDYYTSPGSVHLIHASQERLQQDILLIRKFEKEGFILNKKRGVLHA